MIHLRKACIFCALLFFFQGCIDHHQGEKMPVFSATDILGHQVNSIQLKGKVVVIKVWATWCGSCVEELPALNQLVGRYKSDSSVVFLAITDDSNMKITSFLKKHPFDYQHITDAKELKLLFQTGMRKEIPEHIIVDREGTIVFDESGEQANIEQVLARHIEEVK
jgi:cytochrome c biogenesis protein CcmG, thiol:disulfide interchange protein DsbE